MASAAIPTESTRDQGGINTPLSRSSVFARCRFLPRTPRPPTAGRKKQSNYGNEWSEGGPSYGASRLLLLHL